MRTFSRRIFPLFVILAMTTVASATTDAPNLDQIDIDLYWTVPVYGPIGFSGRQEWQNGVGYTDTSKSASGSGIGSSDRWQITGLPCMTCFWINSPATLHPGQFVLDFES